MLEQKDWAGLRARLQRDGYLFIRGAVPRAAVEKARHLLLKSFQAAGNILEPDRPLEEGILQERCGMGCVPFLEGINEITHSPEMLAVFEGEALREIYRNLLEAPEVRTFDFKWLRAMPRAAFTGAHLDTVYMGRGSPNLLTCWIPFGQTPLEKGALAVCEGSHTAAGYQRLRETYGAMDHERDGLDGTGWFTEDPQEALSLFGGQWRSHDFEPGDIVTFTMHTLHMSISNTTDQVRISADVRWQPSTDLVDPRYVGSGADEYLKNMSVAGAWRAEKEDVLAANGVVDEATTRMAKKLRTQEKKRTIVEMRNEWGFPVPAGIGLK